MITSEAINELAAALAKAQGAMTAASLDKVNPHFKSKYSSLAAIWDAIRIPLTANGLSVIQSISNCDAGIEITTKMLHASGQWIESRLCMPISQNTVQAIGSAITYGKRYALVAMAGIASDEDDDGETATPTQRQQAPRVTPQQPVTPEPPKPQANTNTATWELALASWKFQKERAIKHGGLESHIERCKPHADAAKNKDIQAVLAAAECLGKVVDLAIGTPTEEVIEA